MDMHWQANGSEGKIGEETKKEKQPEKDVQE